MIKRGCKMIMAAAAAGILMCSCSASQDISYMDSIDIADTAADAVTVSDYIKSSSSEGGIYQVVTWGRTVEVKDKNLYLNNILIDENVAARFIFNGSTVYYSKDGGNIYKYTVKSDERELIFSAPGAVIENCLDDKYLYYRTLDTNGRNDDLVIYSMEKAAETDRFDNVNTFIIEENRIYMQPNEETEDDGTGEYAPEPLPIVAAQPDGSSDTVIIENAGLFVVDINTVYYEMIEYDDGELVRMIRSYDVDSGDSRDVKSRYTKSYDDLELIKLTPASATYRNRVSGEILAVNL